MKTTASTLFVLLSFVFGTVAADSGARTDINPALIYAQAIAVMPDHLPQAPQHGAHPRHGTVTKPVAEKEENQVAPARIARTLASGRTKPPGPSRTALVPFPAPAGQGASW